MVRVRVISSGKNRRQVAVIVTKKDGTKRSVTKHQKLVHGEWLPRFKESE